MTNTSRMLALLSSAALLLSACSKCEKATPDEKPTPTAAPAPAPPPPELIAAHTTGEVSREAEIRVRFSEELLADPDAVNEPLEKSPLSFAPPLDGIALWTSTAELRFRPAEPLTPGTVYRATLALKALRGERAGPDQFEFEFAAMPQSFEVVIHGLEAADPKALKPQRLRGLVRTADVAAASAVEDMVTVAHLDDPLEVTWEHNPDRREHGFQVAGIARTDDDTTMTLKVEGDPIGVDAREERTVTVSGLDNFTLLGARAVLEDERYLELRFSDPLKPKQRLKGLVAVTDKEKLSFRIEGNLVRVYSADGWETAAEVKVAAGVRNVLGYRLKEAQQLSIAFEQLKPAVRFAAKGVIVPTTEGVTVPIEVANLRAIRVEAMRVYEHNLPQFLQVNDLGGDSEMQRVGRRVWQERVELELPESKTDQWVRYGLDLGPLLKKSAKGLYRLKLSFGPRDIVYACPEGAFAALEDRSAEGPGDDAWYEAGEQSYWDYSEETSGVPYYEAYQNRHDPCHVGYYRDMGDHDIAVSRNVMVSDIGLIAKRGEDGSLLVAATDIKTAAPLTGVKVTVLDFQLQPLIEGRTDRRGFAELKADRRPFAVVAELGGQTSLLKLDDGSSLAVGHFDVGGAKVRSGLKGFFYGERGVWRPGDEIFLTFILQDRSGRLPPDHPVHFELQDSRGRIAERQTQRQSTNGFYTFTTRTRADAPTGTYIARARVGGATFEHALPIETVVPNRLKIDLDFGADLIKGPDARLQSTVSARWLHGAIADGLNARVEVSYAPKATRFDRYQGYAFDDPTRSYLSESEEIFDGDLDDEGKAAVDATLDPAGTPPGMLTAHFKTRVFEPSGAFSLDRHSVPFSPYDRYVGIKTPKGDKARGMLLTDTKHEVQLVAVDADGKPADDTEVEVKLYKIEWRWWWEKGEESLADYAGSTSFTPLAEETIKIEKGAGSWRFEIKYPDWGRYLIMAADKNGDHRSGKIIYVDWPGWAGRAQKDQPGGATVLTFVADRPEYKVGETVTLTIPTATGGRGLVSLESGSRVIQTAWIEPEGESTRYTFKATAEMAPTIYANVTFLQPHLKAKNDLPLRIYGVVPVKVFDPATRLEPKIACADTFEPEAPARITIAESKGRAMTYTLAVVDEGLLGLTRYRTPDPWQHFFKREALGVRTWDLFNWVAGAFGGSLERLLAIGGDGEGEEGAQSKARRFPPMVRFAGPFTIEAGAKKSHQIDLPPYIGEVRVMVVAGQDGAFGAASKSVFVKKPLMVAATLPRVLGPDEKVDLPVALFALEDKVKKVQVSVTTEGPIEVVGAKRKQVTFARPGDKMTTFALAVTRELGIATVVVTAKGAGESSTHRMEIDVRHPGRRVIDVVARTIEPGASWEQPLTLVGVAGSNEATLEVSRLPPLDLERRLHFLVRYPHGCVEQTTSAAFPQLYLSKLLDLTPDRAKGIEHNVKAALTRLKGFQNASGGFGYWPGDSQAHDWSSSYVGHFLAEAKRAGYLVPAGMLAQWKRHQRAIAQAWSASGDRSQLEQAYRLYTLALAGAPELGAMNRLREATSLEPEARWRLAAAYHLAGQPEVATKLAQGLGYEVAPYRELGNTFGSDLRDRAMILETLVLLGDLSRAQLLAVQISEALSKDDWLSTQDSAFALVSMARFADRTSAGQKIALAYALGEGTRTPLRSDKPMVSRKLALSPKHKRPQLGVTNQGEGTLFARVILSGLPRVGEEQSARRGLRLTVNYTTAGDEDDVDPSLVEQGTDFVATVSVTNTGSTGPYHEVALSHLVPAGWEIHNERLDPGHLPSGVAFDYQDIRDDRVYTYFDLKQGETKTFQVRLNASYLGEFYLPMVSVEAMYDATIYARRAGRWIKVVRPGEVG